MRMVSCSPVETNKTVLRLPWELTRPGNCAGAFAKVNYSTRALWSCAAEFQGAPGLLRDLKLNHSRGEYQVAVSQLRERQRAREE